MKYALRASHISCYAAVVERKFLLSGEKGKFGNQKAYPNLFVHTEKSEIFSVKKIFTCFSTQIGHLVWFLFLSRESNVEVFLTQRR